MSVAPPHHSFTLRVAGISTEDDHYEDILFEAGCGDALIGVLAEETFLDFDRAASSFDEAVKSAIQDVEKAGGKVIKLDRIVD
jgi:hypothetical protein